jgi:hypothetical protein
MFALCGNRTRDPWRSRRVFTRLRHIGRQIKSVGTNNIMHNMHINNIIIHNYNQIRGVYFIIKCLYYVQILADIILSNICKLFSDNSSEIFWFGFFYTTVDLLLLIWKVTQLTQASSLNINMQVKKTFEWISIYNPLLYYMCDGLAELLAVVFTARQVFCISMSKRTWQRKLSWWYALIHVRMAIHIIRPVFIGVVVWILAHYARGCGFDSRTMQTFVCMNMSVCIGSGVCIYTISRLLEALYELSLD